MSLNDRPLLSIVVVTYQCRPYAMDLLADLDAARSTLALEVLVVDNASTDGTVDAIRATYPWVDIDPQAENLGFGRANNRAIRKARADIVLLLNPDTRVTVSALRACLDELTRCPDVGVLTPRVVDEHEVFDRRCMRGCPTVWGVFCHVTKLDRVLPSRGSRRYLMRWLPEDTATDVEAVSGAVMFTRTEALRQVGGFDERFFMYGEDIDLCARIAIAGWRNRYWPGATVTHLGGRSASNAASRAAWAKSIGLLLEDRSSHPTQQFRASLAHLAGRLLAARRPR